MGTICVLSKTLCPTLKGDKWNLVFHRKRLELRVLPWQQHSRCRSVSFAMCIAGAKPEEHCFGISGVILGYVLCCFTATTHAIINISKMKKRYSKKENTIIISSLL